MAIEVRTNQLFRVVNTFGGQVVDTRAFDVEDANRYLSMEHSRSALYKLHFQVSDTLVDNHFQPMLEIMDDTSPGVHDTLHAACSPGSYQHYMGHPSHPNCQDNLLQQLADHGIFRQSIPCPWNLFESAKVGNGMELKDDSSPAKPGDYIELRAIGNILLICSACPSMVGNISGNNPSGAALEVL